ncbi:alpha/beta hydrolase [Agrococcus sediminis]|jgi:alpha-beta hydrolase superfamily lysophospholipase|uniref:alpha/beta hydrolase n=1 Tax=Agrococcus TaxID=46352 RepID=UPI000FE40AD1|nr:alpha/beta hydrolase [Agrococcus sp. SCSIO52902]RWR24664.1 alpha/beta hydrolase [Agrococcus lahaulensis]UOW01937.1 alpha/beta hydrolase [Agrococcus sp. SCSIO52902]
MPQFTAIREESTFVDLQGVTIHRYRWRPGRPKAVVLIAHGLGEHALRYEHVAQRLVQAGYAVWAIDQRGHGATGVTQHGGDLERLGRLGPGGMRAVVGDLVHVLKQIRAEHPGLPVAVLGHSWGSLSTQILLNGYSDLVDAAILSGTAYRMPGSMNPGDLNARHAHLGDTGYEWISRDPAVVAAFAEDPLTFPAKVLPLFGVADGLRLYGVPKRIDPPIPMLIAGGSDDSMAGPKSLRRLGDAYRSRGGLTDVTVTVYPGARHEILNEINRAKVLDDIVAWLDARLLPA